MNTEVMVDRNAGSFSMFHISASASLMRSSNRIRSSFIGSPVVPVRTAVRLLATTEAGSLLLGGIAVVVGHIGLLIGVAVDEGPRTGGRDTPATGRLVLGGLDAERKRARPQLHGERAVGVG